MLLGTQTFMPLSRYVIFCFLFVGLVILSGCGDGDPADEWVGMWEVETSDGEKYNEVFFKMWNGWGLPRSFITRLQVEQDYYFGDDGRWQSLPAGPALVASGVASRLQSQPVPPSSGSDCCRIETNNRNFAIVNSIFTQNNVNLKFEPLKCDF